MNDDKKFKCKNFEICGNYTNAEHSKWCEPCSLKWQFKQSGYEIEFNLTSEGKIIGMVLTREDIYKKNQGRKNEKSV